MANKAFSGWLASLAKATVQPGDLIPVVQGGVSKKAPAGQAGGLATVDADGRVAEPGRVLAIHRSLGATEDISLTASAALPDPVITISPPSSVHATLAVFLIATVAGNLVAGTGDRRVWLTIERSTDGGGTWGRIAHPDYPQYVPDGTMFALHGAWVDYSWPPVPAEVRYRIRMILWGDDSGEVRLCCGNWRQLIAVVMEVT